MIRRTKKEVFSELPDRMYETLYIEFSDEEKQIYEAIKNEITEELENYHVDTVLKDKFLSVVIVKMTRLRQATGSLKLISGINYSSKINALKELLVDILQEDSKAIIFTEFKEMSNILYSELQKYNPCLFTGDTPQKERQNIIKEFNDVDKSKILIMSPAGGEGLNLQRANYIIHYDLPWSVSKIEQREGRAHRIGQKNKVTVFMLIVKNSIDEYVFKVLHKKQKLSDILLKILYCPFYYILKIIYYP